MQTNTHSTRAFTLLVAVLLASVAISIGAALAHVSKKQLALSLAAQDSITAFYAASSALECATAADQVAYIPGEGRFGSAFTTDADTVSIECYMGGGWWDTVTFALSYTDPDIGRVFETSGPIGSPAAEDGWFAVAGGCAHLTVTKNTDTGAARLYARGTNTCDFSDPTRVVERGVSARY